MRALWLGLLMLVATGIAAAGPAPEMTVATADGGSTYRLGERIGLRLSFSSAEAGRYEIDEAGYDRSGRMGYESFQVLPASGWVDPLAEYFENRMLEGGGLTGYSALQTTPFKLEVDLNEWVRFDRAGVYTVKVSGIRRVLLRTWCGT